MVAGPPPWRKVCEAETDRSTRSGAPPSPGPGTVGMAWRRGNTFQHYSATITSVISLQIDVNASRSISFCRVIIVNEISYQNNYY